MNKISKRIVAGASAAALLVSAVGVDQLADLFMKTSYADSTSTSTRNGKSTGFNNLEQDTNKAGYYNTGYGLHTNKTATEATDVNDGRTFDVDLESWYVGENPVDVATILDASGSMAWTVDTLEPLNVSAQLDDDDNKYLTDHYGNTDLAEIQKANGGYLPQDVVDLILDKTKTDNSKLSYADYMYYIYESRSSVSEFVPLGYWDGGVTSGALEPIGYYKFDGSLKNEITGKNAKYITQESGTFNTEEEVTSVPVEFAEGGLDLYKTDKTGNVVIDISSINKDSFTISFDLLPNTPHDTCNNTPLIYVGNKDKSAYFSILRGYSNNANSTGSSKNLRVKYTQTTGDEKIESLSSAIDPCDGTKWYTCTINIKKNTSDDYTIECSVGSISVSKNNLKLSNELYIILGGEEILKYGNESETYNDISKNYIKNLKITSESTDVANFPLESNLKNTVTSSDIKIGNATLMKNAEAGSGTFNVDNKDKVSETPMNAKYGEGGLDLNETAKNGAIMLDVVPQIKDDKDGFTISMKLQKTGSCSTEKRNIFYLGDKTQSDYLQFFRSSKNGGDLILSKDGVDPDKDNENKGDLYYQGGLVDNKKWYTNTLVFKPVAGGYNVTPYVNGKPAETLTANGGGLGFPNGGKTSKYNVPNSITLNAEDVVLLLGALSSNSTESEHYIKDLYIFDEALNDKQVALIAENKLMETPEAEKCGSYHATTQEDEEIAQISESLRANPDDEARRGWYYVNSHSTWADISDCLKSGKQYLGIINDFGLAKYREGINTSELAPGAKNNDGTVKEPSAGYDDDNQSIATIPSVYQAAYDDYEKATATNPDIKPDEALGSTERAKYLEYYKNLTKGNDSTRKFTPAENERSLQFYIDKYGYLRCFYCTGDYSWKVSSSKWSYNPRTFCSVVYVKEKYIENKNDDGEVTSRTGNATKYEELNYALNQFYQNLAKYSDLSNSAIVRFSTHNLIQGNSKDEVETNAVDHLKMLIMKDWTNYSDVYSKDKSARENYLQNLLIPDEGETSKSTETSSARTGISEYPYVMTGGTYTWTGLKAFYDNMVNTDKLSSGDTVYNIANDARDKYLIIFTDGRDNTIGSNDTKYVKPFKKDNNDKVTSYGDFSPAGIDMKNDKGEVVTGDNKRDAYLARAWADKLKDEGYTIFCVMLATGSISPTTNEEEYNKAYKFLETLAGDKDNERDVDDCISVVGVDNTLEEAFADILTQIQQPRADYTVQDYIDPRFDLVDKDGNLYKLGAGGKITVKSADGTTTKEVTVGNVIDKLDEDPTMTAAQCQALGLAYTPRKSEMVNRKATSGGYDNGDGVGTGYIYYDNIKDMYYLRWEDQVIPMEDEAFDTDEGKTPIKYLDVWSATIRLKAKDDFIGGNNILTNGNEAGENLVYSDATIENMDKNPNLYFTEDELNEYTDAAGKINIPYREKLKALSGTDRKINAVDAGGVSQAVYGDGIDIPSSGFPRTTVNVRLLKLDAKNLNDVIYMGEVVSPTMMLSDLEDGYMTGSYYLEYLERYAYRVYGDDAGKMPLIELLNKWLKIDDKNQEKKTFTIPYIYLPDPEYNADGTLAKEGGKVKLQNSTGASWDGNDIDFADLNLRDVTGFITYTWKREYKEGETEEQQQLVGGKKDITKDYVVKNTNQIKYNLQLKFTPLKETADGLDGFTLDENFINADSTGKGGDKFFNIGADGEFAEMTTGGAWTTNYGREDYLKAMIQETRTYEPHVMYDGSTNKWVLVNDDSTDFSSDKAVNAYVDNDDTEQTKDAGDGKVTDKGVYDWDNEYKPEAGDAQIETGQPNDYYTNTPENVGVSSDGFSLEANTTYTKDVVNAALALELFVDGKYLNKTDSKIKEGNTFTFEATRYYDDPIDPPPYDEDPIGADTGVGGKKYKLTFKVTDIPADVKENEISKVWAKLTEVKVEASTASDGYKLITDDGYTDVDALPIGTYVIQTKTDGDKDNLNSLNNDQFKIGTDGSGDVNFKYFKIDNDVMSYTHDKFPTSVSGVSESAATDTKDGDYLIWNDPTDNSTKNIAESNRTKDKDAGTQTATFYFGTVKDDSGDKGESVKDYLKEHPEATSAAEFKNDYAKDRLGIIMLSADNNSLAITKEITNYKYPSEESREWTFTVTIKTDDTEWINDHGSSGIMYDLYTRGSTSADWTKSEENQTAAFTYSTEVTTHTLTLEIKLTHNQKVILKDLPDGDWQVTEAADVFCTPHNNANGLGEDEWRYQSSAETGVNTLTPISQVDYINEFPYELPSAGGSGTLRFVLFGTLLTAVGAMLFAVLYYDRRKRARK